jgi:GntR family transcriptional regulator
MQVKRSQSSTRLTAPKLSDRYTRTVPGTPVAIGNRPESRSLSVRTQLTQRIHTGLLAAGSRLPSEPALASELGVSRATLREALRELESEGLLHRRWGSGTYVAEGPRVANSLDLNFGVTDAIRAAGMRPGTLDGRYWFEPASAAEAARLSLEPGQDVLVVERVRTADGRPVVFSRDLLPGRVLGERLELAEQMLQRSLYAVLREELGVVIHHGVANFRPISADVTVARKLQVPRGALLLAIWQVDYTEKGTALLSSHEYHLADAFEFTVLRRGPGRQSS